MHFTATRRVGKATRSRYRLKGDFAELTISRLRED
jgi:hypothetical protein